MFFFKKKIEELIDYATELGCFYSLLCNTVLDIKPIIEENYRVF